jgi:hypothetical protein
MSRNTIKSSKHIRKKPKVFINHFNSNKQQYIIENFTKFSMIYCCLLFVLCEVLSITHISYTLYKVSLQIIFSTIDFVCETVSCTKSTIINSFNHTINELIIPFASKVGNQTTSVISQIKNQTTSVMS